MTLQTQMVLLLSAVTGIESPDFDCAEQFEDAALACPARPTSRRPSSGSSSMRTGAIRRSSRAKQRLIALLDEQKQAVIHRAVTRGLDPTSRSDRPESGVDWLGTCPSTGSCSPCGESLRTGAMDLTYARRAVRSKRFRRSSTMARGQA